MFQLEHLRNIFIMNNFSLKCILLTLIGYINLLPAFIFSNSPTKHKQRITLLALGNLINDKLAYFVLGIIPLSNRPKISAPVIMRLLSPQMSKTS